MIKWEDYPVEEHMRILVGLGEICDLPLSVQSETIAVALLPKGRVTFKVTGWSLHAWVYVPYEEDNPTHRLPYITDALFLLMDKEDVIHRLRQLRKPKKGS